MELFAKKKKGRIVSKIKNGVRYGTSRSDQFIAKLYKYRYKVLTELKYTDYDRSEETIINILDSIVIVGKRLDNINFANYDQIRQYIVTKEDYISLDKLCQKYDYNQIIEYLNQNISLKVQDITSDMLAEYYENKREKQRKYAEEHDKERINNYLTSNGINISEITEKIESYSDAVIYVKLYSFLKQNNMLYNRYLAKYVIDKMKPLFNSIDPATLSQEEAENLIDYIILSCLNFPISINNIADLRNYEQIKQTIVDKKFAVSKFPDLLYHKILPARKVYTIIDLKGLCHDLVDISNTPRELLVKKYHFSEQEIELIDIMSGEQGLSGDDYNQAITTLFSKCQAQKDYFKNIDLKELLNKIRNFYGYEISESLTKLIPSPGEPVDESKIKYLGTQKYGVPVYEKEDGEFKFLVNWIYKNGGMNETVEKEMKKNGKMLYDNPELWDNFPRELGTNYISTTLISSNGISGLLNENSVIYGYDQLNPESVVNISAGDGRTPHDLNTDVKSGAHEGMYKSDKLIEETMRNGSPYNEVAFDRYNGDKRIKPNFILCFDDINEASVMHAKYHQVPIIVIKTQKYLDNFEARVLASGERLKACDKNNLPQYCECLKDYRIELIRYGCVPIRIGQRRVATGQELFKISEEIKNVEKKIRNARFGSQNVDDNTAKSTHTR